MNTMFLLMAEFNSATVPLADISEKYFGLKPATAEKKALIGELPIPTFRVLIAKNCREWYIFRIWLTILISNEKREKHCFNHFKRLTRHTLIKTVRLWDISVFYFIIWHPNSLLNTTNLLIYSKKAPATRWGLVLAMHT
ncbi:pyocin activator PrtN family protein [Pectobacterium polaris]|uniref:pyocin activator PrtN family protein n=1 Tax=Pectobacterium polaris TaxID=2042057 RepID=UPI003BA338DC